MIRKALASTLFAVLLSLPALAAEPKGQTEVTWYGHAAFLVKTPGGTVLAIDPWLGNPAAKDKEALAKIAKVDFILVSHGHFDHVGDTVALQKKSNGKIVGAFELGSALVSAGVPKEAAGFDTLGNVGGVLKLNDEVTVALVQAVHSSGFQKDDQSPLQYAGSPLGFVIQIRNGPTLYHTGDTGLFGEMKRIGDRFHPDVLLACIGGHFTMDPKDAALAARETGAKTIVPMHYGTFPVLTGTPDELEKELGAAKAKTKMLKLEIGVPHKF